MPNTTWNLADLAATTLSNGNLTATPTGIGGVRSILSVTTGKYYFELTFVASSSQNVLGVANASAVLAGGSNVANTGSGGAVVVSAGSMLINGASQGSLGAFAAGVACGIALDMGGHLIWFRNATTAGNWNASGTANPATGAGGFSLNTLTGGATTLYALSSVAALAGSTAITANFGDTAFVGAVPAGFAAGFPGTAAAVAQARVLVLA
jgi:hypothetical protein